jgi:hypothetical protein
VVNTGRAIGSITLGLAAGLCFWPPVSGTAAAQNSAALGVKVVDAEAGTPIAEAVLHLRRIGATGAAGQSRRAVTGENGAHHFAELARGRYQLVVDRFGYRRVALELTIERSEPLLVSLLLDPVPLLMSALGLHYRRSTGPSLQAPRHPEGELAGRAASVRTRQQRFLSTDARQLSLADLREANSLWEDDVLRALQRLPGIGSRDDYSAEPWTRGAQAGQTSVLFDGIPLLGGFHALGVLSGLNSDALARATFQPGVAETALQGGGAGVIEVESRSADGSSRALLAALSPISARLSMNERWSDRFGLAVSARRSLVDALPSLAGPIIPRGQPVPYAFGDVTARADIAFSQRQRIEASIFWQNDRVFGDVADVAHGNDGDWGARVARVTAIFEGGGPVLRQTIGLGEFHASLRAAPSGRAGHAPLHPTTESHYQTLVWETRLAAPEQSAAPWSVGLRVTRDHHDYNGPGLDLARLLSTDELTRRGMGELTPIIVGIQRAHLLTSETTTRVGLWGERRQPIGEQVDVMAGLRVESGDRVLNSDIRLAPRLQVRYQPPGSPLSVSAAYGRAYQYLQSTARTDVLRSGLRASEVLVQADRDSPALRSDVFSLGTEWWAATDVLFGATAWLRTADGILLPEPTPGVIDRPRPSLPATGRASGVEVSARKLEGRLRGFANYTLSRSQHGMGARQFDASEDRRHVANLGVVTDLLPAWRVGATGRAQSGAPYTRITLIDAGCEATNPCNSPPPVLYGTPAGQRARGYMSLDLLSEWTLVRPSWALTVYGQLRNALGSRNAVTYHASCVCVTGESASSADLRDRFDRGLPRLPVVGLRARF